MGKVERKWKNFFLFSPAIRVWWEYLILAKGFPKATDECFQLISEFDDCVVLFLNVTFINDRMTNFNHFTTPMKFRSRTYKVC